MKIHSFTFDQLHPFSLCGQLSNDCISVFFFSIKDIFSLEDACCLFDERSCLTEEEQKILFTYKNRVDQVRYYIGHNALRLILSEHYSRSPSSFSFQKDIYGKPFLTDNALWFNISHAGDYVALAFSMMGEIGIDIQDIRFQHPSRLNRLAQKTFPLNELQLYQGLSEEQKQHFFYERWACREAFLKGIGYGLTLSTSSFSMSEIEEHVFQISDFSNTDISIPQLSAWRVYSIPAPKHYFCCIAAIAH